MKRFLSIMLVFAMLLSMAPTVFAAESEQTTEDALTINETNDESEGPAAHSEATVEAVTEITEDTVWAYLEDGTDPAGDSTAEGYERTSWTAENYDDSAWKTAAGPFGAKYSSSTLTGNVGTGYVADTILAGCTAYNDVKAYFFRTELQIDSLEGISQLEGTVQYDDAAIIYINGVRVAAFDDTACDDEGNSLNVPIDANLQYGGSNAGAPKTGEFTVTDLSVLHDGVNTVAVELHQGRHKSSDVWFHMTQLKLSSEEISTAPTQTDISLSIGADQTQMNFTWHAPNSEAGTLLIAKESDLVDGEMPENAAVFTAVSTLANDGLYSNQATVTGLEAGVTYAYQLVNDESKSEINTFKTDNGDSFSFAYVADPQIGAGTTATDIIGWDKTLNIVAENETFSDISFMLSAGDQVNTASSEDEYDGYLNHDALLNLPVATVIGNHDNGSDAYNEHFNVPNESAQGTTTAGSDYYFVYNNVLFMVLNSNDQSVAGHKEFMTNAINANPNVDWKIVSFHHSLYTVASHATNQDILNRRDVYVPAFKELGIDVVLMGHDHVYCRSYMMDGLKVSEDENYTYGNGDNNAPTAVTNPTGILYVTANSSSGSKYYNIQNATFEYSAVQNQEKVPNVSKVSVSEEQFTITTYRTTDMSVVDSFTINKSDETDEPDVPEDSNPNNAPTQITEDAEWKYLDDNTDPSAGAEDRLTWIAEDFDDSKWKTASGPFSSTSDGKKTVNNVKSNTVLSGCNGTSNTPAYFFRSEFYISSADLEKVEMLVGTVEYDDAVAVYINGTKVYDDAVNEVTTNLQYAGTHNDCQQSGQIMVTNPNVWHVGVNTVAVEVHQSSATSSNVWFNMNLAPYNGVQEEINEFAVWSYLDDNTDPASGNENRLTWIAEDFDDSTWKSGYAPFGARKGYGDVYNNNPYDVVATKLDGVTKNENNVKNTPAYFLRTDLYVEDPDAVTSLVGSISYDDAVIVYINGTAVYEGQNIACDANGKSLGKEIDENLQYAGVNQSAAFQETLKLTDEEILNLLHQGNNTVAVELHQSSASSGDLWFDFALTASTEVVEYQSDINMILGADNSQMNFTWYYASDDNGKLLIAKESELVDGKMPDDAKEFAANVAKTKYSEYSNKVTVTDLEANTTYAYQIINGSHKTAVNTFTTEDGDDFSFAYVADPQIGASSVSADTGYWAKTLEKIDTNANFSDTSFLLMAGDQVDTLTTYENADTESEYSGLLEHDTLRSLPIVPVIGNHDNVEVFGQHFMLPNESADYGVTAAGGDSYFVYNNVLFLNLNSNDTSAAEHKEFMKAAIEATKDQDIQWKVVSMHHSLYSTVNKNGVDNQMDRQNIRTKLVPIFEELDVDVVLLGHDHVYCRTYMMKGVDQLETDANYTYGNGDDAAPTAVTDPEGILYVSLNSGSGSKYNDLGSAPNAYAAYQSDEKVPNLAIVSVTEDSFTITTYRTTDMTVLDSFTINKTEEAQKPEEPEKSVEPVTEITDDTLWAYLDDGTDPAGDSTAEGYVRTIWTAADYDDSAWKVAAGPFGAQAVSAGNVSTSVNGDTARTLLEGCTKYDEANVPAYFFRTKLQIDSLEDVDKLVGTIEHDDAVLIYINGTKVYENNNVATDPATGSALDEDGDGVSDPIISNNQFGGVNNGTQLTESLEFSAEDLKNVLKNGENIVAVELHNNRQGSSDVWFSLTLAPSTDAPTPVQTDISLSMGADQTKMNFTWYAPGSEAGTLLIAKESELEDGEMPANAQRFEAVATVANDGQYSNQVTAINLEAGTTYAYQLVNGEDKSKIRTFTTDDGDDFTFAYVGDPQIGAGGNVTNDTNGWASTLNQVATSELFADISFMLSAGDQVNTATSETEYDGYLNHDALLNLPVATVIGNHDSGSDAYNEHFNLANESTEYGITNAGGDSYFVYNNVLFMVLNSNDQSAAEHREFMQKAIAANPDVSWKIVTFHHSLYTVASHAYDDDILSRRAALVPIFTELDIDVVLMGHDHVYCRSYMMNGLTPMTDASIYDDENYSSITDPTGILYVTANSGSGSKTYNIKNETFAYSAVKNQEHVANVSKISISDEQFTITTYRSSDLSVIDTFTINRTNPAWDVEEKIDAIGEVTLESEEAIETARKAYDALTEKQKAEVENYQTLLDAEHEITILMAQAAKDAAEAAQDAAEVAQTAAEEAKTDAEAAAAQAAEDKTAAEEAAKIAQEAQAKAEAAKAAAETAKTAAEAAAKAAAESNVEAAKKAAEAAESATASAQNAADAAGSAAAAAEACKTAQEAQAAAEAAQKAAEEAAAKAEADRKAAEQAEQEAKAAEEAAQAAAAAAELALEKYNALTELDEYVENIEITTTEEAEAIADAVDTANEAINAAADVAAVTAALETAKAAVDAAGCPSEKFTDIPEDAWYHEAVDYVLRNNLMQGDGNDTFDPNKALTRAMLVQIIYNMEGKPAYTATNEFSDVAEGKWYYDAVNWANENGIVTGYGNGKFGPDDLVTREQMVTIFWRYAGEPAASAEQVTFADAANVSAYAVDAVIWASENGIVNGVGNNKFDPKGNSTRAQAAKIMQYYCQIF